MKNFIVGSKWRHADGDEYKIVGPAMMHRWFTTLDDYDWVEGVGYMKEGDPVIYVWEEDDFLKRFTKIED